MTTIKLTVTGAHAAAQVDGPLTSGMVGLPVVISCDDSWEGLTRTLVCRSSTGQPTLDQVYMFANVGSQGTVAPEVMLPHRELYLGIEGHSADGTLVVPTIWAHCGTIQPGAKSSGIASQEATPEVWDQLASQMGVLEKLDTDRKENLVAAINELSQEAQASHTAMNQNLTYLQAYCDMLSESLKDPEKNPGQFPGGDIQAELPEDGIPRVFLEGIIPTGTEETQATMTYVSNDDTFTAHLNLCCAQDASLDQEKKSYAIRMFYNADRTVILNKSFLDWGSASNRYVLRSNFVDHSHTRNIVLSRLWRDVMANRDDYDLLPEALRESPRNGAADGFPVKVYTNGTYQGIYTWNMGPGRWNMEGENQGVLRALTNSTLDVPETPCNFRALWSGIDGEHWAVEAGSGEALAASLNQLITFVQESDDDQFRASIGNYLDLPSAMDYFLFQHTICGVDGLGKNLHLATYDGTKWFCSCGDMDAAFLLNTDGTFLQDARYKCPEHYLESRSLLWERLVLLFTQEIMDRYHHLRTNVLSFSNMCCCFERFMEGIGQELYREDAEICPSIPLADSNNIQQIRNAIRDRLVYCDKVMKTLGQEDPFDSIDYTLNPLANVNWTEDIFYSAGIATTKPYEHCTEKFRLQNCLYQMTYSAGSYPTLYVWDEDDNYLGTVQNQLAYFTGNSKWRYIFRINQQEGFDPANISILPVNNDATTREHPIELILKDLPFTSDSNAIMADVHDHFNLSDTINAAAIAARLHHANMMLTIGTSYAKPADWSTQTDKLVLYSFYLISRRVHLAFRHFDNSVENSMAHFEENNIVLKINT